MEDQTEEKEEEKKEEGAKEEAEEEEEVPEVLTQGGMGIWGGKWPRVLSGLRERHESQFPNVAYTLPGGKVIICVN